MVDASALPAALLPGLPLGGDEIVRARQDGTWVYPTLAQILALVPIGTLSDALSALTTRVAALEAGSTAPLAQIGAANALIVALTQRVATLEGRPDPCVALSGSLPTGTLQLGTSTQTVAITGLLATDRVSVEPVGDLPAGLVLAWAHPSAAGLLTVAIDAVAVLTLKVPIQLAVTALR